MKITPADPAILPFRHRAEVERQETRAAPAPVDNRSIARIDPFDAEDVEFDFVAAQKAAASTLLRDQQQQRLAEMADARSKGSISVQAAAAAYREFEA
jgi:hypothetical protein